MHYHVLLLVAFLFLPLTSACDKSCLNNCFSSGSTSDCLRLCACEYPYSIAQFGGRVVTEDGREFLIQDIPTSETHYVSDVYDCNLKCGQLCFRFAKGWNLIKCVDFCGCSMFVTETTVTSSHSSIFSFQKDEIEAEEEGDCLQQCRVICENEKCTTVCQADVCGSSPSTTFLVLAFVGIIAGVFSCALCFVTGKKGAESSR